MTGSNIYGPGVSWRDLRRWAISGIGLWFPDYLRDAERHEGLAPPYCQLPKAFRPAPDVRKWPEDALPAIIIGAPGLTDTAPIRQADRTYMTEWIVSLSGIVHGRDEADTELIASCYGLALRMLMLQQAAGWASLTDYVGPALRVESVTWQDEGYDEIPWSRSRTLVAATTTFSVVFRDTATSMGGPDSPTPTPTEDPGDFPTVVSTELDLTREEL